jgi:hypothetical protein
MRTDLAHLGAGVVLALAGCALALSHVAIPSFVPFAALTLLGVGAGLSIPALTSDVASKPMFPTAGNSPLQATTKAEPATPLSPPAPPERLAVPLPPAPPAAGASTSGPVPPGN